jgi:hypothetical protein
VLIDFGTHKDMSGIQSETDEFEGSPFVMGPARLRGTCLCCQTVAAVRDSAGPSVVDTSTDMPRIDSPVGAKGTRLNRTLLFCVV